jgi:FMN reductase
MTEHIVIISGSPRPDSRSTRVAAALGKRLGRADLRSRLFSVTDFVSADLLFPRAESSAIRRYIELVRAAPAVVFATPVYKATYSGGLKLLVDLIPPDALRGKAALAIATGRVASHSQSLQRAFDDLYRFFDVGLSIPTVFLLDEQLQSDQSSLSWDMSAEAALERAATALLSRFSAASGVTNEARG